MNELKTRFQFSTEELLQNPPPVKDTERLQQLEYILAKAKTRVRMRTAEYDEFVNGSPNSTVRFIYNFKQVSERLDFAIKVQERILKMCENQARKIYAKYLLS